MSRDPPTALQAAPTQRSASQMHKRAHDDLLRPFRSVSGPTRLQGRDLSLAIVFRALKLHWPAIALAVAIAWALGAAYIVITEPLYTARAALLVESRDTPATLQPTTSVTQLDPAGVESQLEVLKSDRVAEAVIESLNLREDPEFTEPSLSDYLSLSGLVQLISPAVETSGDLRREVIAAFLNRLSVKRIGLSYVIEVSFASSDPAKAARIANGVLQAYFALVLEAKNQSAKQTGEWLRESIANAEREAGAAARAAQEFRIENGLVQTARGLLVDHQLSEANGQLVLAHASVAEAEAKLNRLLEVSGVDEIPSALVSDALRSDIFNRLRIQYLDLRAREATLATRFGEEHSASASLKSQISEIERSMRAEMGRMAEAARSDLEIANHRLRAIERYVAQLVERATHLSTAQARLQELEGSAQRQRSNYENLLQRYSENAQRELAPGNIGHVITPATEPLYRSHPRKSVVLGLATFAGLALGGAYGFLREISVRGLRSSREVLETLGKRCLAIVPAVPSTLSSRSLVGRAPNRETLWRSGMLKYAAEHPLSSFAEALRALHVTVQLGDEGRPFHVLGVSSGTFGEGVTTIAVSLAQMAARRNARTLLIDGNFRDPSISRSLRPELRTGSVGLLSSGTQPLLDSLVHHPNLPLSILPCLGAETDRAPEPEVLSSPAFAEAIRSLRAHYDLIVLDLAPFSQFADVSSVTPLLDAVLVVAEWGKTPARFLEELLESHPDIDERVLGLVLNKANVSQMGRM